LFGTPYGGEGLLTGLAYADDFVNASFSKRARVLETIAGAAGAISTDIVWLLNEDQTFWLNDDSTQSEVA
jgi:hypothetical protein